MSNVVIPTPASLNALTLAANMALVDAQLEKIVAAMMAGAQLCEAEPDAHKVRKTIIERMHNQGWACTYEDSQRDGDFFKWEPLTEAITRVAVKVSNVGPLLVLIEANPALARQDLCVA